MSVAAKLAALAKAAQNGTPKTATKAASSVPSTAAHPDAHQAALSVDTKNSTKTASAAAQKASKECQYYNKGIGCPHNKKCWDIRCREKSKAAAAESSPKSSGKVGDGRVAAAMAAMEKRLNERLDTIETKVESGFTAQQASGDRLQEAIVAMIGGIAGLTTTIERGIAFGRSTAALPAPETHGSAILTRPLPELPAPESSSHLTNFANVATRMKPGPLNDAVKSLIPPFVARYSRTHNPDALACLLLAFLSGKKKSDLVKMGEFTRNMVLPLLSQTNLAIFKKFFEEIALKCRSDSCVRVNNSTGGMYEQTFHLLGKEETDMVYLIKILREEA